MNEMRKIGIDGNLLCGKRTGMGTVVYNVLLHWRSDKKHMITLYVPEHLDSDYCKILEKNGITVKVLGKSNYMKWEQIILPSEVKRDGIDVLWCPYNTSPLKVTCKTVVTINDVIYMNAPLSSAPSIYKKMGIIYRRTIVPLAAKRASAIITISEFAKNEIASAFRIVDKEIKVIYLGADFSNNYLDGLEKENFFKNNEIKSPYILGFGSLEARKNTIAVIRAFNNLPTQVRENIQLVLFGFRGFKESEIEKYLLDNRIDNVKVLGYVSDEEKNTLYSESSMFVFPSLSEGFGIPVLEAYANKTPVITSNSTSLPEVAGDAAILVEPTNENKIRHAIMHLIEDHNLVETMIEKGIEQLSKFNWNTTARDIMRVIMSL